MTQNPQKIAISATFTAEPLEPALTFWVETLGIDATIEFAPYNQVIQQLLDSNSLFSKNQAGINVILVRMSDWQRQLNDFANETSKFDSESSQQFIEALKIATLHSHLPYLVCFCPSAQMDAAPLATPIINELSHFPNVYFLTTHELAKYYPVENYSDLYSDQLGRIPFTPLFFTALATYIIRKWFVLQHPPYKVIVLDADETLWHGICGESGPLGIQIDDDDLFLQKFMVQQYQAGMLITLCSKNQEEDVIAIFEQRPEMQLKRHHLVNWRINWQPKSENLKSLAEELQLGLESFIFIDDNPIECAEVQAHCPQVLVLQLPQDKSNIRAFLNHVWFFDHLRTTIEDQQRTRFYQEDLQRSRLQQQSLTLTDFLVRLNLKIEINPIQFQDIPRVAQLTQRTNQFNVTTIRRSEGEISTLLYNQELEGLAITVSDRFGDYGLVGTLLFRVVQSSLIVDTFLLSCRTLGRGVEYQMLAELGKIALIRQLNHVQVTYLATRKNQPALDFLMHVGHRFKQTIEEQILFNFPAEEIATIVYQPSELILSKSTKTLSVNSVSPLAQSPLIQKIATELTTVEAIFTQINVKRQKSRPKMTVAWVAPVTPFEKTLAHIWCDSLGITDIGTRDHFFTLGGDSLIAVQLISRLREKFNVQLSIQQLFNTPTIAGLALIILEQKLKVIDEHTICRLLQQVHQFSEEEAWNKLNQEFTGLSKTVTVIENVEENLSFNDILRESLLQTHSVQPEPATKIAAIGLVTRNRLKGLQHALTSYIDHIKHYGKTVKIVVADDSNRVETRQAYQQMLSTLAKRYHVPIFYTGWEEKYHFAKKLIKRGELPEEVVNFALFDIERCGYSAGANRNALLLATLGETFLSVDDDTCCRSVIPSQSDHRLTFATNRDPAEITFFPDRNTLLHSLNEVNTDILSSHEQVLGKNLSHLITKQEVNLESLNPHFLQRFMNGQGRVLVTLNGLFGDCGWGAPFGYWDSPMGCLLLEGNSRHRLTHDETSYRLGCISREVLRLVNQLTISDATFSMSTFMGLDNRELLPPYFPIQRGQDILFGMTIWHCFKTSYFAHLPVALFHTPLEQRTFWPDEIFRTAVGTDTAKLLINSIHTFKLKNRLDDRENLQALGQHLMDFGTMSLTDFIEFSRFQAWHNSRLLVELMEQQLSRYQESPIFWANDVKKYLHKLQQASVKSHYWLPLDLLSNRTIEEVQILSQKLVYKFGQLLYWWPAIINTTKELYAQGNPLERSMNS